MSRHFNVWGPCAAVKNCVLADEGVRLPESVCFIPLRWLCREFLNEYAAEAKVRMELKARKDVIDFVFPGGIYDDNRVDRPMHGAYPELVDGQPVRRIGNAIFPNGTIRADGLRQVTIGKRGARHPAVVAVALVEGK